MHDRVERFLAILRDTHSSMVPIYTQGGRFHLYRILREIWPQAEAHYCVPEGHVYTRIDERWYDIKGRCARPPAGAEKMDGHLIRDAFRWHGRIDLTMHNVGRVQ